MKQLSLNLKTKSSGVIAETEGLNSEPHVFSVSELNSSLKSAIEEQYGLVWLQGEISNFKAHTSGHYYFSLKDKNSQINAVMFKGFNRSLKFSPTDGMEVLVRGKVTVYEPRGSYQVFCELMEPLGAGALQIAFEQLKAKLQTEGLFDLNKKRPLPKFPQKIAIITAPTGAAIRDMLHVLNRRYRALEIILIPAVVQGEQAPKSIVNGLELANKLSDIDVIIVGRGGGSIEDLWGFNDERVARAIAASRVPTISAVGHEVDFTIADFVADLRAPTPSAAAEVVVKDANELIENLKSYSQRLKLSFLKSCEIKKSNVELFSHRLVDPHKKLIDLIFRCDELLERLCRAHEARSAKNLLVLNNLQHRLVSPKNKIQLSRDKLDRINYQMKTFISHKLERLKAEWSGSIALLDSLGPLRVVDRGYGIVKDKSHKVIRSIEQVNENDEIEIQLSDGFLDLIVKGKNKDYKKRGKK